MAKYPTTEISQGSWPNTFNVTITFNRLTAEELAQVKRFARNLEDEFARQPHVASDDEEKHEQD